MRYLVSALLLLLLISITSCRKDFSTIPSSGNLAFSKDTVYLDTVFTNIGSATYNLKVYNRSNSDITIPDIRLENGTSSKYRLNVDGVPGKAFQNVDILAKDSIFIFIETTIDITSVTNPLYTDKILFDTGSNQQDVDLVTLVQDARFIYPGRDPVTMDIDVLTLDGQPTTIHGRFLEDSELTFTNAKPYVVYGYAAVPANKTLTIEAGARIHFHSDSGLIVDDGGSLKVNGSLTDKVTFEGDRLEHSFSTIPGQWGTIWMRAGSIDNEIHHAIIKNGIVGVLVDSISDTTTRTLTLTNTEIYNHSNYGILGRETNIQGTNLVLGNAGQASLAATIGGTYNFTHSTFANYWNNGIRQLPTVLVNNFFTFTNSSGQEVTETRDLHAANFNNCIIDGNSNIEFILDKVDGSLFNFSTTNCMIQFNDINGTYAGVSELDFTNATKYPGVILNGTPHFRNTAINDFIIGNMSDAINKANGAFSALVPLDILGVDRTSMPDIGAYQHITF
ncbi:hypothetical protein RQM59_10435 [Flavobacteriaceae bacterium S356]|uniref:Right handed beta helix domain-containing protein n=1 Tax=Asprobacillus argus TaxID=3076534 RepID=A0ABU3LI97_9FLAO|nr:hypothetical protein [Flavobacteriaceae bacterium S356]